MQHTSIKKSSWVPPTGRIGPQEPAVGSSARPDGRHHHALGNAQLKLDWTKDRRYMETDVLRLRGGGNADSDDNNDENHSGAMDVDASSCAAASSSKRGPSSPGDKKVTKKVASVSNPLAKAVNLHAGWLEQMAISERAKKLTVGAAEGILERVKALKDIFTDVFSENCRLSGKTQVTQEQLKSIIETFSKSLSDKTAEIEDLKRQNIELREALETRPKTADATRTEEARKPTEKAAQKASYAQSVVQGPPKAKRASKKDILEKCREAKTGTRFTFTIPSGTTVATAKMELWNTVKGKIQNPRARTVVRGDQITCQRFGHRASKCDQTVDTCGRCAVKGHRANDCKSVPVKCANCGLAAQSGHAGCVALHKATITVARRTDFGSK
ncbi:hypothetical protein ACI65C_004353 [Semiaphis heraclei]